jgi:hypothetical protein
MQWTEWDAIQELMEFELSDCLLPSITHYLQGRKKNTAPFFVW